MTTKVMNGEVPFQDRGNDAVRINAITSGERPVFKGAASPLGEHLPEKVIAFTAKCWADDPLERPSANDVQEALSELSQSLRSAGSSPLADRPVSTDSTDFSIDRAAASSTQTGEGAIVHSSAYFRQLGISVDDTVSKFLPTLMMKNGIHDEWANYVLFICYAGTGLYSCRLPNFTRSYYLAQSAA